MHGQRTNLLALPVRSVRSGMIDYLRLHRPTESSSYVYQVAAAGEHDLSSSYFPIIFSCLAGINITKVHSRRWFATPPTIPLSRSRQRTYVILQIIFLTPCVLVICYYYLPTISIASPATTHDSLARLAL